MDAKDRIIVALDVPDLAQARALAAELAPHVGYFKVGLELITAVGGPAAVAAVKEAGGKVMFDGKFNDIPNTMAGAARSVASLGVDLFTVHASAGRESVQAAAGAAGEATVVGVTVLTSMSPHECLDIFGETPEDKVEEFAGLLERCGAGAIVCSPNELFAIARSKLRKITPGVRPEWAAAGDQKRVTTPAAAVSMGADLLVIGRPILRPPPGIGGPAEAARRIAEEIGGALAEVE